VTDPNDLRLTAYHEAGHAVVACLLGRGVERVEVGHRGSFNGRIVFTRELLGNQWKRRELEVTILHAGWQAEKAYLGRDPDPRGVADDEREARRLMSSVGLHFGRTTEAEFARWNDDAAAEAAELVARHWEVIRAVAERLATRKKVSGRLIRRLIRESTKGQPRDNQSGRGVGGRLQGT
jgi:hypothetical protein